MVGPAGVELCASHAAEHHLAGTGADVAFRGRGYEHAIGIPGRGRLTSVFSDIRAERGEHVGLRLDPRGYHVFSAGPPRGRPAVPACHGVSPWVRPCLTRDRRARAGASIRAVTTTLSISTSAPRSIDADAVVIGVFKGPDGPLLAPGATDLDEALGGGLAATLATLGVTGQAEEVTRLPASAPVTAPVIAAVGLGPAGAGGADAPAGGSPGPETLRRAAGAAVRTLTASRTGASQAGANGHQDDLRIALALPVADPDAAEAVAVGALLGGYAFTRYRQRAGRRAAITVLIPAEPAPAEPAAAGGTDGVRRRAEAIAGAVSLARDLVNTAPSDLVPAALADEAERVAAASGLQAEVLDEKALEENGYGGIVGVGQGSVNPPRLVRLEYAPAQAGKTVVFVGKGITFDSGGLSLKPRSRWRP